MPNTFAIDPYSLRLVLRKSRTHDDYRNRSCTLVAISVPIICDISLNVVRGFPELLYRLLIALATKPRSNWSRRAMPPMRRPNANTEVVMQHGLSRRYPVKKEGSKCYAVLIKSRQNSVMVWTERIPEAGVPPPSAIDLSCIARTK